MKTGKKIKRKLQRKAKKLVWGGEPEPPLRFGTEGWRGVLARDFTLDNVRLVARGLARYLVQFEDIRRGAVVAYDTRFAAARFAREVAEVLTSVGMDVRLATAPTPTPALSFAVRHFRAAAGVMLTASHNPPEWLGIKFKASYGGPASGRAAKEIEQFLADTPRLPRIEPDRRRIEPMDLKPAYLARLAELADLEAIRRAGLRLVIDPMHGSGAGYLRALLEEHGIPCVEIRGNHDPLFGGTQPEPMEPNLEPLRETLRREGGDLGAATDGDADRLAAMDTEGNYVDSHKAFALLLQHLVERRGLSGGVAKTTTVSKIIDRLAEHYGLPLHETPVGFKHIADLMLERDLLMGGEESGGIGLRPHLPERDGLLNSLLLAEAVAAAGHSLGECVAALQEQFGPLHYRRVDLHLDPAQNERALERIAGDKVRQVGEWTVVGREDLDGVKLYLLNAGWVMVRASGTEPVLRLYAEAPEPALVDRVVQAVEELVRSA